MASDCILHTGTTNSDGYGITSNGKRAHRVAYEQAHGRIPPGYDIDHKCRNRLCINPDHLEAVTHRENVKRMLPQCGHADWRPGRCPTCRRQKRFLRGYK